MSGVLRSVQHRSDKASDKVRTGWRFSRGGANRLHAKVALSPLLVSLFKVMTGNLSSTLYELKS